MRMTVRLQLHRREFGLLLCWRDGKNAESPQTSRARTRNRRVSSFAREGASSKKQSGRGLFLATAGRGVLTHIRHD